MDIIFFKKRFEEMQVSYKTMSEQTGIPYNSLISIFNERRYLSNMNHEQYEKLIKFLFTDFEYRLLAKCFLEANDNEHAWKLFNERLKSIVKQALIKKPNQVEIWLGYMSDYIAVFIESEIEYVEPIVIKLYDTDLYKSVRIADVDEYKKTLKTIL